LPRMEFLAANESREEKGRRRRKSKQPADEESKRPSGMMEKKGGSRVIVAVRWAEEESKKGEGAGYGKQERKKFHSPLRALKNKRGRHSIDARGG